ncbi:MAG: competence protein ComEC [Nocardioidaceae bacterium]|nr:competence protein ComEC [Nocardioidaceae bacterium]
MVAPAAAGWLTALVAVQVGPGVGLALAFAAACGAGLIWQSGRHGWLLVAAATFLVMAAVALVGTIKAWSIATNPVADAARHTRFATVSGQVASDPRLIRGAMSATSYFRATVHEIETREGSYKVKAPILVFTAQRVSGLAVGSPVVLRGMLRASEGSDLSAVLTARTLQVKGSKPWWWAASDALRGSVTEASMRGPPSSRALVPALVHGDDARLTKGIIEEFQRSGLTHLLAVSGTNLTIVLAALLMMGRAVGVRGRGQWLLGSFAVVGFVLLARPEPSVLRAAAMGVVALAALGHHRGRGGLRALSWAVIVLLLIDPWLASAAGFALSVCATAGIVVLAPRWAEALGRWMPRWAALALSVPLSAQIACTPLVAAISGQISFVSVVANLLAAPAVAPATVLGLAGGVVGLLMPPVGSWIGWVATLCTHWISVVAHYCADLPGAAAPWKSSIWLLVVVCLVVAVSMRAMLSRPVVAGCLCLVMVVGIWRPISPGWPPRDWIMVVCDVGQGDSTVLNVGGSTAVVVDAGLDARPVRLCLDRLGIRRVALLVFTHSHADHVGGWQGVLAGRHVDHVAAGPSGGPRVPGASTLPFVLGGRYRIGPLSWTVLAPGPTEARDSNLNNESLVMMVVLRGVRILLTGDIEEEAQSALVRSGTPLQADVLKVPHHGSASQDPDLFARVGAQFATISSGRGNSYGHPAPRTVRLAEDQQMAVLRTDVSGDIALVLRQGRLTAVGR